MLEKLSVSRKKTYLLILVAIFVVFFFLKKSNFNRKDESLQEALEASKTSSIVNIYSSRKEELIKNLVKKFTETTGIKVNYVFDDASKLISRIQSEGKKTQADVFITTDVINLILAVQKDILSPVDSEVLKKNIPANLRSDRWFGLTKRSRIIVYSKDRVNVSDLDDYEGLADPKWKGRLLLRSSSNPYNQSLIASVISANGEEKARSWIRGMVANLSRQPHGGDSDQIRAVASGEGDLTIVNSYYFARIMDSQSKSDKKVASKVDAFFPNQSNRGTMVNISGGGVVKHAKNRKNAISFLEFMSGPQAQKMYAENNHEYPVLKSVNWSDLLRSWDDYKIDKKPLEDLVEYMGTAIKIADEEGWK